MTNPKPGPWQKSRVAESQTMGEPESIPEAIPAPEPKGSYRDRWTEKISKHEKRLNEHDKRLTRQTDVVNAQYERNNACSKRLDEQFGMITRNASRLDNQSEGTNKRLNHHTDLINENSTRLDKHEDRLNGQLGLIDEHEKEIEELEKRLEEVAGKSECEVDLHDNHDKRFNNLTMMVEESDARLTRQIDGLRSYVNGLGLDDESEEFDGLKRKVDLMRKHVNDNYRNIKDIEKKDLPVQGETKQCGCDASCPEQCPSRSCICPGGGSHESIRTLLDYRHPPLRSYQPKPPSNAWRWVGTTVLAVITSLTPLAGAVAFHLGPALLRDRPGVDALAAATGALTFTLAWLTAHAHPTSRFFNAKQVQKEAPPRIT